MSKVRIRPARTTDRSAVEGICAEWGADYVPEVWDEWVADPHGQLAVAELKGRAVGFAKLSRLADDEWWLKGLRVDAAHRRQGIAGQLQAHLVQKARQAGRGTLRLGTLALNEPVHRLAARDGFRRVATYRWYRAGSLPAVDVPPLRRLAGADLPAAWTLVGESPCYQAAGGLYESFWTWQNLTRERLARHLAAGDVWWMDTHDGASALVLICRTEEAEALDVGYVDGAEGALVVILRGTRGLAAQLDHTEVNVRPVDEPRVIAAVEAAGYEHDRDHDLWIFELRLGSEVDSCT
jgi:GNAT superfamily N-acetyltransferase